jgi:hypothetical protein
LRNCGAYQLVPFGHSFVGDAMYCTLHTKKHAAGGAIAR